MKHYIYDTILYIKWYIIYHEMIKDYIRTMKYYIYNKHYII